MNDDLSELKAREEAKRERNWNAAQRWRVIQATITWAEAQATVRRNTPEACRKKEAEILASMQRQM